jgi:2-iminobutanoate/2-iminopropanoate deaminase
LDVTTGARQPEGIASPRFPYSPVVVAGDLVYTAGQVGHDATGTLVPGGVEEQTRRALDNVGLCLAAVGCSMDDVVKVTAFLSDLGDFEAFNRVYAEHFSPPYPARSTVGVALPAGILVEVEAVARRPA